MNHDEKNPNPDMQPWIEPELETRVVAWVMGEASPFEIAELERLLREKPELAIFKRRIEAVHGLVGEAAHPDRAPLKMSAERRAKLLQTIGATETAVPAAQPVESPLVLPLTGSKRKRWHQQPWIWATAASVAVGGLISMSLTPAYKKIGAEPAVAFESGRAEKARVEQAARRDVADATDKMRMERASAKQEAEARIRIDAAVRQNSRPLASAAQTPGTGQESFGRAGGIRGMSEPLAAPAKASLPVTLEGSANAGGMADRSSVSIMAPALAGQSLPPPAPLADSFAFAPPPASQVENRIGGQSASFAGGGGGGGRGGRGGGMGGGGAPSGGRSGAAGAFRPVAFDGSAAAINTVDGAAIAGSTTILAGTVVSPAAPALNAFEPAPGQAPNTTGLAMSAVGSDGFAFSPPPVAPGSAAEGLLQSTRPSEPTLPPFGGTGQTAAAPLPGEALALSPFTVSTDKDLGYMAGSTLSGGRVNSSIGSLPQSVAVVTKEQLANVAPAPLFRGFGTTGDEKKRDEREVDDALQRARRPAESAPKIEETSTAKEPVSTFSLHVSDVSFRLAQAALARGEVPEPARIRPEEFYNAFDYGDPVPSLAEKVGARIEQSAHPVLQQRNLVRVAFKVPAAGRAASQPLRLTVLLDTSGSMEREDRAATVRRALEALGGLLGPQDRVTLIGFARQPRLLAENVPGNQSGMLVGLVANTPVEGGTNLEEALKLAGQLARRHQLAGAQNRIVLLTDGAANLGNASPAQLSTAVETLRQQGIAFDACGVGLNGLDDGILEALTRRGDGRYYVLDSPEAADGGFARQLAGAFRPAAENVKVQVRFNPTRVAHYRLIGFDQHRLSEQDFRNDAVDTAELAAEEAAVALYEVEVLPQGSGEVGELFVRFRDPASGAMVERSWPIAYDAQARAFNRATPSLQLAGASALLAEKLRQSPVAGQFKLSDLTPVVNSLRGSYGYEPRVQELVAMFDQARRLGRD